MPEATDRVGNEGGIARAAAVVGQIGIEMTVKGAEATSYLRGFDQEKRLRSAALDLIDEAVGDYEAFDRGSVEVWRAEAAALAENKARDGGGSRTADLEKSCLVEIVAREIRKPYRYAKEKGWGPDMEVILKQAALPGAFGSDREKQEFWKGLRHSLDLTSLVNQKMPWRLFCQLNLSAPVGETEKEEKKTQPEVMLSTFMSSRSIDDLFKPVNLEVEEGGREAVEAATKLADVCLLEAVLGEVAEGVKSWDLAAADKAGELSPMEKLLKESGLGDSVATGVNRGFVWKTKNGRVDRTDSVVTNPRVIYLDRGGRCRIFNADRHRGRVRSILEENRVPTREEVVLSLVYELGNDPVAISKQTNLSVEEVLPLIAKVRSIPTLVVHPEEKTKARSTIEAFSKVRRAAQKMAHQRGRLNGAIIMGGINWRMGEYHITTVHNHAVRDGVEAAAMTAHLADRFQVGLEEVSAGLPVENKAGALIYNFAGDEELMKVDPEFFLVDPARLHLGEIFPAKAELGELPGEEVAFAVEVTGLWRQAERIAAEFRSYRDSNRKGEKTILTSPYFVMEMLILDMHQKASGSKKIGVLSAKKGMQDLDLHPVWKGIDVEEVSWLMREAEKDQSKRAELDSLLSSCMDETKKSLAISNMKTIETVAQVAGAPMRELINRMAKLPVMKQGARKKAGADMLSIIPRLANDPDGISVDGPAMYSAQERAITISGWVRTKGNGLVMIVTMKRNARPGQGADQANKWAHDFAGKLYTQINARERILAARGLVE